MPIGSLLALDPGLSLDPTGLVAARIGRDHAGHLRIAVDILCEMPSPVPPEAAVALVEQALAEMWSSLHAEPLVVVDISNNLALLSLLGRLLPMKRLVPLAITAGESSGAAPGMVPVIGTDGRTRHLAKWSRRANALLGQLDALGSTGAIILPDATAAARCGPAARADAGDRVEVTRSRPAPAVVPARVHDDVLMASAMLAWAAPMALKHGLRQRGTIRAEGAGPGLDMTQIAWVARSAEMQAEAG